LVVTWNIRSEDEDQFKGVEFAFFRVDDYGDKYVLVLGTQVRPNKHPRRRHLAPDLVHESGRDCSGST
jgi:hypothetical protein